MLGIKKSCKSSHLLEALKINKISTLIETQQINLLRAMFVSSSKTSEFYTFLLSKYFSGTLDNNNLLGHVKVTCNKYSIPLISVLCDKRYCRSQINHIKRFSTNDGIGDNYIYVNKILLLLLYSIRGLLSNITSHNNMMLNLLLRSE